MQESDRGYAQVAYAVIDEFLAPAGLGQGRYTSWHLLLNNIPASEPYGKTGLDGYSVYFPALFQLLMVVAVPILSLP